MCANRHDKPQLGKGCNSTLEAWGDDLPLMVQLTINSLQYYTTSTNINSEILVLNIKVLIAQLTGKLLLTWKSSSALLGTSLQKPKFSMLEKIFTLFLSSSLVQYEIYSHYFEIQTIEVSKVLIHIEAFAHVYITRIG